MSLDILDLNDAELSLWRDGKQILHSPGYARLEGRDYRFGEAARSQARLHPQQVNHRYWAQMDMEPLNPSFGPGRHSADLVHSHLLDIHAQATLNDGFVLTAPGSLQHDQLALLLGIIEHCPFNAGGLVDRAVAHVAALPAAAYNWHIELQLHQALVTGVRCSDGVLSRDRVIPIPGSGWLAMQDAIARAIADAFIRQTRFDPRRQAATEQALYDQLPALLLELHRQPEKNLELGGHQARIESELIAESCGKHYQRIKRSVEATPGQLLLAGNMVLLPAITAQLAGAIAVPVAALEQSVVDNRERILADDKGLLFITSLPAQAELATSPAAAAPIPAAATLAQPVSVAIPASHSRIEIQAGRFSLAPVAGTAPRLNGEPVHSSTELASGDQIELEDGSVWRLQEVTAEDGSQA
jgi:hypothetical protein